ncbi:UNVERIFIED_ORG: uncharacterized protein DUF1127 [Martelella mediterranea]
MTEIVVPQNRKSAFPLQIARKIRRLTRLLLVYWPQRRRQRLILRELTDERLRDIGIEPHQARQEAGRPFWD